jgi:hypothetical protein
MAKPQTAIERLTAAEIRRLSRKYQEAERRITEQLANAWTTGADRGVSLSEKDFKERVRARAIQILDGDAIQESLPAVEQAAPSGKKTLAEKILPPEEKNGRGAEPLHIERAAVRLILESLVPQSLEAEAAEALRWAEDHRAEWLRLAGNWVCALARFQALDERVRSYLEAAGPAGDALELTGLPNFVSVSFPNWNFELGDILRLALANAAITENELKRAQKAELN